MVFRWNNQPPVHPSQQTAASPSGSYRYLMLIMVRARGGRWRVKCKAGCATREIPEPVRFKVFPPTKTKIVSFPTTIRHRFIGQYAPLLTHPFWPTPKMFASACGMERVHCVWCDRRVRCTRGRRWVSHDAKMFNWHAL